MKKKFIFITPTGEDRDVDFWLLQCVCLGFYIATPTGCVTTRCVMTVESSLDFRSSVARAFAKLNRKFLFDVV